MNNIKKVKIIAYAKKLHVSQKLFKTDFEKYNYLLINFLKCNNIYIPEKTITQLIRAFEYKNNLFSMIQKKNLTLNIGKLFLKTTVN